MNKPVIHRNTNYIKFRANRETNACKYGNVLEAWKDCAGWHVFNPNEGKRYFAFIGTIRNCIGEIIEQDNRKLTLEWRLAH